MSSKPTPVTRQGWQQHFLETYAENAGMNFAILIAQDDTDTVIETMVGSAGQTDAEFSEQVVLALAFSLLSKLGKDSDMEFNLPIGTVRVVRNTEDAGIVAGNLGAQVEKIKAKRLDG